MHHASIIPECGAPINPMPLSLSWQAEHREGNSPGAPHQAAWGAPVQNPRLLSGIGFLA